MSRSLAAWSQRVSLAERSRSRFACNFLCVGSHSLLFGDVNDGCQWKSSLLSVGFCTGAHRRHRAVEVGLHL
jgi:hypothetical protein